MWLKVDADRILYVDKGVTTILCDRLPGRGSLVLYLTPKQVQSLRDRLAITSAPQIR